VLGLWLTLDESSSVSRLDMLSMGVGLAGVVSLVFPYGFIVFLLVLTVAGTFLAAHLEGRME